MKSLTTWLCSLSCLLISNASPGFALDANDSRVESDNGAKGLFYKQMESPNVSINTGVQYWIELHRDGETIHATNKTQFQSGDTIRFHVKPNIDGYAYIMLREGSQGEQSQLFPNEEGKQESNRITHGREMVLPAAGALEFDQNAGTEKLTLLISRKPIDAKAFISREAEEQDKATSKPQRIAMASSGAKDLIPDQVLVSYTGGAGSYGSSLKDMPAAQHQAQNSKTSKVALAETTTLLPSKMQAESAPSSPKTTKETSSKDVLKALKKKTPTTVIATAETKTDTKTDSGRVESKSESKSETKADNKKGVATTTQKKAPVKHIASASVPKKKAPLATGVVTVVYKNPDGVLAADISLEHI